MKIAKRSLKQARRGKNYQEQREEHLKMKVTTMTEASQERPNEDLENIMELRAESTH